MPVLGFLFIGGNVAEGGGLVRGSETGLVLTSRSTPLVVLLDSAMILLLGVMVLLLEASSSVNSWMPNNLD